MVPDQAHITFGQSHVCLWWWQKLPVSSDALNLHCLPFFTPDVRMWVQLAAANLGIFAGLTGTREPRIFGAFWGCFTVGPCSSSVPQYFCIFEAFLRQVLLHPQYYTSLYILLQALVHRLSTQRFLVLFEAFLLQVLVHRLSLYQQTQGFLMLFLVVVLVHHLSRLSLFFWCFLRLFCCRLLFIAHVIWVCINKLFFDGTSDFGVFRGFTLKTLYTLSAFWMKLSLSSFPPVNSQRVLRHFCMFISDIFY